MSLAFTFTVLGLSTAAGVLAQSAGETAINFQPCPELNANISALLGGAGSPVDCATLSVPLDYTNPESGPLSLQLFRSNATEEPVLGTVLMNFGGPGGTAAENLPAWAELAHTVIGPQWNLVSWDPRGTGYTIPFACDVAALTPAPTRKRDVGTLVSTNLTEVFLNGGWELAGELADYCAQQANETGTLIGTAFTARDMMEIVDALGEDGFLRYYGWSYGTALGSYAAAMFPERIERMVLDGNVNPHDYQAGHYGEFADDIDEAFAGFLQACFNVTDDCALYSLLQPNTTEDLLDAINLLLAPFANNATSGFEAYTTYVALKGIFVQPLYFPATWPRFATTLASILNGTITEPANETGPAPYGEAANAVIGIRASDATFIANSSEEYLPQVRYQASVSPGFSDIAYFTLWTSAQWRMPAKERYWGDFRATTKTPILYINGEFDPVTPLVNAYNGSAGFTGSAVLPHSGYGHGVFADPSQCVANHVQTYFLNATLPGADTRCEPDASLAEQWLATVQRSGSNSTSNGGGNSSDSGNSNGTGEASENGAHRDGSRAVYGAASMLAIAALVLL
jgi:pimeloyl-ACP methyl ester carboxylesterase